MTADHHKLQPEPTRSAQENDLEDRSKIQKSHEAFALEDGAQTQNLIKKFKSLNNTVISCSNQDIFAI